VANLLKRVCKQDCVYWAPSAVGTDGQVTEYEDPVDLKCRWEDVQEVYIDKDGNEKVSRSRVFVLQDVKPLGVLWLGTIEQLTTTDDPFVNEGAYEIRQFDKTPDFKAKKFLRIAWL
jgi:hypothetical protein